MGAYSPVTDLPVGLVEETMSNVIEPVLERMAEDGSPFRGFLYAGLVLTEDGPKVLEFNVRLGDPETQAVLPRMTTDLIDVLEGSSPDWASLATVNVVLAAAGYPDSPEAGAVIGNTDSIPEDVLVFHAGTRTDGKRLLVDGGRVLSVVGTGRTLETARDAAYQAIEGVRWPGVQFRTDIAAQS
jgi:phosphoribosylamine--glycine ligase